MATRKSAPHCEFEKLVTRNVPHILEMIFFELDYDSFMACGQVCKAWKGIFSSQSFDLTAEKLRIEVVRSGLTRFTKRYGTMHAKKEEERKNNCPPGAKFGPYGQLWPDWVILHAVHRDTPICDSPEEKRNQTRGFVDRNFRNAILKM